MIQAQNSKLSWEKKLKILNFYSENCPPCHAFMPNFFEAEKSFWKYFDFILVNSDNNIWLFQNFRVMWTPTVIILDWEKVIFNQSWVPNGSELKNIMMNVAKITESDLEQDKKENKKKWFFGLF